MKKLLLLVLVLPLACEFFWHMHKSSFSPENVMHMECAPVGAPQEICALLERPFHYIGEGAQCFAFESEDKSCVIKLFKKEHRRFKNWKNEGILSQIFEWGRFEPEKKARSQKKWSQKFIDSSARYEIALQELKEETGLLFVHTRSNFSAPVLCKISSKFGKSYEIDLAKTPFILQKRVDLVPDRIASLLKQGKRQEAIQAVIKLHALLANRTLKGFTDDRQCFSINYGFSGDKPLQIDIGRIVYKKEMPEQELARLTKNLCEWVDRHFPEIAKECRKLLFAPASAPACVPELIRIEHE